jgi:hypothetical protein
VPINMEFWVFKWDKNRYNGKKLENSVHLRRLANEDNE